MELKNTQFSLGWLEKEIGDQIIGLLYQEENLR